MVMDLNKCLGCQTCTMACKKLWTDRDGTGYMYWNNVETRPGHGYPRQWDQRRRRLEGRPAAPSDMQPSTGRYGAPLEYNYEQRLFEGGQPAMPPEPVSGPNWDEDVGAMNGDENFYFYLPRICNHCTNPRAWRPARARPSTSARRTASCLWTRSDARVTATVSRACPYKKIYFNEIFGKSRSASSATRAWRRAR